MKVCKSSDEAKVQRKIFLVIPKTREEEYILFECFRVDSKVELTPELEEKIMNEINVIMKEHTIIDGVLRCNKHFCDYDGMTITEVVFQKLKEQAFSLLEKDLHEKEGEKNPAEFCTCGVYIGHRGFCSKKCHDNYYDNLGCIEK